LNPDYRGERKYRYIGEIKLRAYRPLTGEPGYGQLPVRADRHVRSLSNPMAAAPEAEGVPDRRCFAGVGAPVPACPRQVLSPQAPSAAAPICCHYQPSGSVHLHLSKQTSRDSCQWVKMKRKGISLGQSPNVAHDSRSASAFFRRTSGTRTPNSLTCPRPSWFGHIQCPTFTPLPGPIFTKQADVRQATRTCSRSRA